MQDKILVKKCWEKYGKPKDFDHATMIEYALALSSLNLSTSMEEYDCWEKLKYGVPLMSTQHAATHAATMILDTTTYSLLVIHLRLF